MIIQSASYTDEKILVVRNQLQKEGIPDISSLADRFRSSHFKLFLCALAISSFFVFVLCFFFAPKWETNDDVAMSMIAHGYGIAVVSSPNILFSNVLWGYLVRVIPEIHGVFGYSIATLSVLVIVGVVVIYGLFRGGVGPVACICALALILVRPVLFPQFTINAGLLLIAALMCWRLYAQQNDRHALVAGCILAFLSYLVRSQEFFLVLFVALPLLPWSALLLYRSAKIAIFVLVFGIAVSAIIDHQAYQGDAWKSYNELNSPRAAFTDYDAGRILRSRLDILERHGYTVNDIDLIDHWFFDDPRIANPQALKAMLTEMGPLETQGNALSNALTSVRTLLSPILLPCVLAAFLLALLRPSWQVAASWGLCIVAVFVVGLLGRPGVFRVYVPLASLLLVAPFLNGHVSGWRYRLIVCILLVAAVINAACVFSESRTFQIASEQARKKLAALSADPPPVVWGATFPYEAVYPVLGASSEAMSYHYYGLGCSTLAPFSVAYAKQKAGQGLTDLLTEERGVQIMATGADLRMLEVYCKERLHGQLKVLSEKVYGKIKVSQCQCEVMP
jgi:hypothetical protein